MAYIKNFLFSLIFFTSSLSANEPRPMNYEDIIILSKPEAVQLSPDGMYAAFTTRKGNLEENRSVCTLYFWNLQENRQIGVYQADKIEHIQWKENNSFYFIAQRGEIYELVSYSSKGIVIATASAEPICSYTFSSDGQGIYYTLTKRTPKENVIKFQEEGYVYRWGIDDSRMLVDAAGLYKKENEEIWYLSLNSKNQILIATIPYHDWPSYQDCLIKSMKESPDGSYLCVYTQKLGSMQEGTPTFYLTILICNLATKECHEISPFHITNFCWISSQTLIFQSKDITRDGNHYDLWLYNCDSSSMQKMEWCQIQSRLQNFFWNREEGKLYATTFRTIFCLALETRKIDELILPKLFNGIVFSIDNQAKYIAYIEESSNTPPEISIYDLTERKCVTKTRLNPQIDNLLLGHVEEITITIDNLNTNGYLVHPVNEKNGKRYPIIIATYGFSGKFIADGEWHSTFPAQVLASEGYCVLLLNLPSASAGWVGLADRVEESQEQMGWNRLLIAERAIDLLVERGIGDPTKVGVYGWSHGAFITYFLISHSDKFHVACLGEGGDFNPSGFWLGGVPFSTHEHENIFGGPPWGETLKNYSNFSPFFHVEKIKTPILMEFAKELSIFGLEMYVPLSYLKKPVELVVYEGEEHNFVKPKARIASMKRKVEWFDYWLLGKENNHPDKKSQYKRWSQMKE